MSSGTTDAFCQGCLNTFNCHPWIPGEESEERDIYIHPDLKPMDVLRESAKSGCPLCRLVYRMLESKLARRSPPLKINSFSVSTINVLLEGIKTDNDQTEADPIDIYLDYSFDGTDLNLDLKLLLRSLAHYASTDEAYRMFNSSRVGSTYNAPVVFGSLAPASIQSNQETNMLSDTWMRCTQWISECLANHPVCCAEIMQEQKLPTRLIDVGRGSSLPCLVYSTDIVPLDGTTRTKYVTLSHCWGRNPICKLTSETESSFRAGFDIKRLTRTFQDAISITRRLEVDFGVKYLWIDALCIVQDSENDWRHEGSLMADVYGNSWCNLVACDGRDGENGMLHPSWMQSFRLTASDLKSSRPIGNKKPHKTVQDVISKSGDYICFNRDHITHVDDSVVNTRAWVLQERALAARSLTFSRDQVFWACQETEASESFPSALPTLRGHEKDSSTRTILSSLEGHQYSLVDAMRAWKTYIRAYSKRHLTYASDKLPAIAGVARRMQHNFPRGCYLAGLWEMGIEDQLLWIPMGLFSSRPPYRAPSWSWASLDVEVTYTWWNVYGTSWNPSPNPTGITPEWMAEKLFSHVLEINVTTVDDAFGQVTGGSLRIRGPLRKASRIIQDGRLSLKFRVEKAGMTSEEFLSFVSDDFGEDLEDEPLYCLPITYTATPLRSYHMIIGGLVLAKSKSSDRNAEYRRVGMFYETGDIAELFASKSSRDTADLLSSSEYEEFDGVTNYTIRIV
ncbi:hypothetical protein EG329_011692 [Mollisiaceae sp. DMI_Dod_QoI]|nr:hypothetical protein EG329_011692 [Helotiales sp. DMI_Dod_QoI]